MLNEINKKVKKGNHLDKHSDDEGVYWTDGDKFN
jgi:hypothetical protein